MPIREDLVASAAKFLQDPSVASSPVESRIAFLQAKNLTPEEVNAALARAAAISGTAPPSYPVAQPPVGPPQPQHQPYYGQPAPYPWQAPHPELPRRDWRDWFIMATVVSGVGYGLYSLTKRYVYPLVAPPTPERLEQDKKSIDEQFERAFALVEQIAKDTETLKASERQRTERLDSALLDLETVINDLKSANRRREDDAQRVRDDVQGLKDALPRTLEAQKTMTDNRLREVNNELKSLKTIIGQRMSVNTPTANYLRPSSGNAGPSGSAAAAASSAGGGGSASDTENAETNGTAAAAATAEETKPKEYNDYVSTLGRSSPFTSSITGTKASIPSWQRPMQTENAGASSSANGGE